MVNWVAHTDMQHQVAASRRVYAQLASDLNRIFECRLRSAGKVVFPPHA